MEEIFGDWLKIINLPILFKALNTLDLCKTLCPTKDKVFKAFTLCPLNRTKVIILGLDPYNQKGVATGLAFANNPDIDTISASLQILKDSVINPCIPHNYPIIFDQTLESWAKQGVLLLNSALTTELGKVGAHLNIWRPFMCDLLNKLSYEVGRVYILLGEQAKTFKPYIYKEGNLILCDNHPAYYARISKPMPQTVFNETNKWLYGMYRETIEWYKEYE